MCTWPVVVSCFLEGLWKWPDDLFVIGLYCQYTTWYYGKELLCGPEPQVQLLRVSLFCNWAVSTLLFTAPPRYEQESLSS